MHSRVSIGEETAYCAFTSECRGGDSICTVPSRVSIGEETAYCAFTSEYKGGDSILCLHE